MINVTIIDIEGSPCNFQCEDMEQARTRCRAHLASTLLGASGSLTPKKIYTIYFFSSLSKKLIQQQPEWLLN